MAKGKRFTITDIEALQTSGRIRGIVAQVNVQKPANEAKKSKYRNKKVIMDYGEGHVVTFDSQKEAARWGELILESRQGLITNLERQYKFLLNVNEQKICSYLADFVYDKRGVRIVEDVKSPMTKKLPVYRLKKKLMKAIYGIDIVEV